MHCDRDGPNDEEYGEGSYNKGFYISIPFDAMTINQARRVVFCLATNPRDGGQH
ncbi:YjbH domain-containing protein [Vibrio vulnificus]|uniref:YjbH domain-containing protein n=1 Tax=Vibrio vulnificus TaxID=672 RepID=UPI00107D83EB|nr:YjbH domain-containing protein [Vibrio vulnificus]QBH28404.1 hypothetical protein FORC77_2681 [Vibrio vulnificus]